MATTSQLQTQFDSVLMGIAQQCGGVQALLDCYFSFLARKTDFMTGELQEGSARKMVMDSFDKHYQMSELRRKEEKQRNKTADEERRARVETERKKDLQEYEKAKAPQKKYENSPHITEITEEADEKDTTATVSPDKKETNEKDAHDAEEEESSAACPIGNGGVTDKYRWTQQLKTVEMYINVKPGTRAKQLHVKITKDALHVESDIEGVLVSGKWGMGVKADETMWTLVDEKVLQISIEKYDDQRWWKCCIQGDPEIDTSKVQPENSKLSDLEGETRGVVEKMMYDQRQKQAGLPTSDEKKQYDMLEQFKKAHPEMDFSKCKMNFGGSNQGGFNF